MGKIFVTFILAMAFFSALAQTPSTLAQTQDEKQLLSSIEALVARGYEARNSNWDEVIIIAKQLDSCSNKYSFYPSLANLAITESLSLLGMISFYKKDWVTCDTLFLQSYKSGHEKESPLLMIKTANQSGEYYKEYAKSNKDTLTRLELDSFIQKAQGLYSEARTLATAVANNPNSSSKDKKEAYVYLAYSDNNLAEVNILKGKFQEAKKRLLEIIPIYQVKADSIIFAYQSKEERDSITAVNQFLRVVGYSYMALAWLAEEQGQEKARYSYLNLARNIRELQKVKFLYEYGTVNSELIEYFQEHGQFKNAIEIIDKLTQNKCWGLFPNSFSTPWKQALQKFEKKQKENDQVNKNQIILLAIASFLLLVSAALLWRRGLQLSSQRDAIKDQRDAISDLNKVGQNITRRLDLESVFSEAYKGVSKILPSDIFAIGLFGAEPYPGIIQNGLSIYKNQKYDGPPFVRDMSDPNQLAVWCAQNAHFENWEEARIVMNDLEKDYAKKFQKPYPFEPVNLTDGTVTTCPKSLVYLPLVDRVEQKVLGIVTVQSLEYHNYTDFEINILDTIASFISVAIKNAQTFEKTHDDLVKKSFALRVIAHDTQTARMSVGGLLDAFEHDFSKDETPYPHTEGIRKIMRWVSTTIEGIGGWAGVVPPQVKPRVLSLNTIIDETLPHYKMLASQKGLLINVSYQIKNIKIKADNFLLLIVLRNLLDNAVKYATGGSIMITVRKKDGIGVISISNEQSINQHETSNIQPYSGWGLRLCEQIVLDRMGGGFKKTEEEVFTVTISFPLEK